VLGGGFDSVQGDGALCKTVDELSPRVQSPVPFLSLVLENRVCFVSFFLPLSAGLCCLFPRKHSSPVTHTLARARILERGVGEAIGAIQSSY